MSRICLLFAFLLMGAVLAPPLRAQEAYCASDGLPRPRALLERFVNADCEACWRDPAAARAGAREVAIDWVLPSAAGEDAALSVAAIPEGLDRLEQLGRTPPARDASLRQPLLASARTLRVAHGLPFNDYIGASIELRPAGRAPWKAWLLLVETLPAGTEGSAVERNLVRAAFQPPWERRRAPTAAQQQRLFELRPMRIPEGSDPARLRVVGWVEDARGRIRAISESRCRPTEGQR